MKRMRKLRMTIEENKTKKENQKLSEKNQMMKTKAIQPSQIRKNKMPKINKGLPRDHDLDLQRKKLKKQQAHKNNNKLKKSSSKEQLQLINTSTKARISMFQSMAVKYTQQH